jgi:hypothetical protein
MTPMKASYKTYLLLFLLLTSLMAEAQQSNTLLSTEDYDDGLRYDLLMMRDEVHGYDKSRAIIEKKYGVASAQYKRLQIQVHAATLEQEAKIRLILNTYGWPGKSLVGEEGSTALWLVLQRSNKDLVKLGASHMNRAARNGEADHFQAAVLQDKALIMNGKKQWYGTQLYTNQETGSLEIFPIADESNLNKRRHEMHLEPIENYLSSLKVNYTYAKDTLHR